MCHENREDGILRLTKQRSPEHAEDSSSTYERWKGRVNRVMDGRNANDSASVIFVASMSVLITVNVAAFILDTVASISVHYRDLFYRLEAFSVAVFALEYLVRLWSCTAEPRFRQPVVGRLRFVVTPLALLDLLAILPSLVSLGVADLRFLRLIRLARFLRIFKLGRYSQSLKTFGSVLQAKRAELGVAVFLVAILLLLASSLMFFVEHDAQPQAFSSIPASMWWAVITLTTVGYGDVYPVTPVGKILAGAISLMSVGLFALPAGILASGFSEEMRKRRKGTNQCPHCGAPQG